MQQVFMVKLAGFIVRLLKMSVFILLPKDLITLSTRMIVEKEIKAFK